MLPVAIVIYDTSLLIQTVLGFSLISFKITGLLSFLKAEFGINPAELGVDPNYSSVELHEIYNTDSILGCVEGLLCVLFGNNNDALNDLGFNVNCQTRRIIESDSSIQISKYYNQTGHPKECL